MHVSIRIQISNLGPLRSADQELADLTLLVGENNSGKTFLATVSHRVLIASARLPWPRPFRSGEPPKPIVNWLMRLARLSDDQSIPALEIDKRTMDWAKSFATTSLRRFGHAVRSGLEYAYGIEANDLRRRTASRRATDCYLRIISTDPSWRIEVRFDRDEVHVEDIDVDSWIRAAFEPKVARQVYARYFEEYAIEEFIDDDSAFLSSGFYRELQSTLFLSWPRSAIHLPAGRTGIMHSYDVLAGNIVQLSSEAGLRPIEIAPLHGTTSDFLSLVIRPERRGVRGRLPRELSQIIERLGSATR